MRFETLAPEKHPLWDEFCLRSDDAWFWHTSAWLQYQLAYRPDLKSRNDSFFLYDANGELVGICPLFLESREGRYEFSFGGSHLPPPVLAPGLLPRRREELYGVIFDEIDRRARESAVARASFRVSPLTPVPFNFLVKFGYLDVSFNSHVVRTCASVEELRKGLRKGHASDVKRALTLLELQAFDRDGVTPEVFREFQDLHRKAAGRSTRPQDTWDRMLGMVRDGQAVLLGARREGRFVGFSLLNLFKGKAYYSSAANDPEAENLPLAHGLQWFALTWLAERGFTAYEIGWQHFGPQLHDLGSAKEEHISRFKRGFGGATVPVFAGERYYDPAFCRQALGERLDAYCKVLSGVPKAPD